MINKFIKILFPTCCGMCGRIYKNWICPKCYYLLKQELKFEIIKKKKFNLFFLGFYENKIRELLLKYKFGQSAYLFNFFIELIKKNEKFKNRIKDYDYIIPVPMYYKNKKIRGYNQTELIARGIEKDLGVKCITDILLKVKENKTQSLLSEIQRVENVKNVYILQNEDRLKNKKILLLDDIYTTGSTALECIKTLRRTKAKIIDVLVIAKTN